MQITLSPTGPAMWFLGSREIKVSLSISNPGPVNVDIPSLTEAELKHLVLSLRTQQITSKMKVETLLEEYMKAKRPVALPKPPDPKILAKLQQKTDELMKRVVYLSSQTRGTIISNVRTTTDLRFLRFLLETEQGNRKRKSVIQAIQYRIESLSRIEIRTEDRTFPEETPLPDVIESDIVEVSVNYGDK